MDTNPALGVHPHRNDPQKCMLRLKLPGGAIRPEQLELVAKIAGEQGADVTTRQELQLYGVAVDHVDAVVAKLNAAGLSTSGAGGNTVRNIVGCPLAGVDRQEVFDVSPVVQTLHEFFAGNTPYTELPKPFRLSVSACADQCVYPSIHDVALVGQPVGFGLWAGGAPLGVGFAAEAALEVVRAAIDVWRLAPASWNDPARVRAELQERLGHPLDRASEQPEPDDALRDHVGVHAQRAAGHYALGIPLFAGHATSAQLEAIAELSRRWSGSPLIRVTPQQNIVLLNVPELSVPRLLEGLAEVELSINAHPIRRGLLTCVGTEHCPSSSVGTTARARQIVNYLEERLQLETPLRLHISGCASACGQHQIGHIGLNAVPSSDGHGEAYDIWIGGRAGKDARLGHVVLSAVPANECARRLEGLLRGFKDKRKGAESFTAFCDRLGDAELARVLTELPKKRDEDEEYAVALPSE